MLFRAITLHRAFSGSSSVEGFQMSEQVQVLGVSQGRSCWTHDCCSPHLCCWKYTHRYYFNSEFRSPSALIRWLVLLLACLMTFCDSTTTMLSPLMMHVNTGAQYLKKYNNNHVIILTDITIGIFPPQFSFSQKTPLKSWWYKIYWCCAPKKHAVVHLVNKIVSLQHYSTSEFLKYLYDLCRP